jgi:aminoglycoside phosphotransferase (APT) family kinase protein
MLFPADQILKSIRREVNQLHSTVGDAMEGSSHQALNIALNLLQAREAGGLQALSAQRQKLADCFEKIGALLPADHALIGGVKALRERLAAAERDGSIDAAEADWRAIGAQAQELAARIAAAADIESRIRDVVKDELVAWEIGDLQRQLGDNAASTLEDVEITKERWAAYLRDRYHDPDLDVTSFKSLAGGFGKQTYLFDVRGKELDGAYVIRRDLVVTLFDNDCHRIETEYALIRAAFAKGFPAPDALWLDTDHKLLPGGHFIVMRRAPGVAGGSIFAGRTALPQNLVEVLAGIMARLHTLPPLRELGHLTESISPELWTLPLSEVVRRYLVNWRELFLREAHLPSPALMAMFGWLLDHIPESTGTPSLLHGDIGFHNFLLDDGTLSAVVDWEFGHIGDAAEDLAYVRNTLGAQIDWDAFLAAYRAAGGPEVSAERLHFFQVWGHLRNACASNLVSAKLYAGQVDDLKGIVLPHLYIPQFMQAAQALMRQGS